MGRTTNLRRDLKQRFYPLAVQRGFEIDHSDAPFEVSFRRCKAANLDVFGLQWDKYGRPRFVVNFSRSVASKSDLPGDLEIPEDSRRFERRLSGRLQPKKGTSTRCWFCQDRSWFSRVVLRLGDRPVVAVVDELLLLFPELDNWFESGRLCPHMTLFPDIRLPERPGERNVAA